MAKSKSQEFLFRDSPPHPLEIVNSQGSYLIDKDGKKYLDFMAGWCVGNIGWKKQELHDALIKFNGPEYVSPSYIYKRWEHLAEKLVNLLPTKEGTCFRATGGTEANEIALKISRAYNKRKKFLAFKSAYHGQSLACLSLVKIPDHEKHFGTFSQDYIQITAKEGKEEWEKTTAQAVKLIETKEISAFICEPIICNLGVIIPPQSFFTTITNACKKTNTLFICDEVATGFGRTGKWFGFEHYNLNPDIITLAKGLSSGYAPIGATIAKPHVAESMRFDFSNYSTFGWHPISVEVTIANIDYITNKNLIQKANDHGKYLVKKLSSFCTPQGRGLCISFPEKRKGTEERCRKAGLIISTLGEKILLFPPLDISTEEINTAVEILRQEI